MEKIIALDLPMTITVAPFGIQVDKEGLEGQKAEMAAVIENLGAELGTVPERCAGMGGRGAELVPQAQEVAADVAADPMGLGLKAGGVTVQQVKYLTVTFPHEVEETGETVKAFFEGLAASAKESGAAVEEAATTTSEE